MKTGDVVRDSRGRSYQVGQLLGRGLWGKSYVVREESTSDEFVLKSALTREDFPADTSAPEEVLAACRDALLEQGRLLEDARWPFLPRLHARFTTADGTPVLLLPKYTTTLEKRLADGCPLSEVLESLTRVGGLLRLLADGPGYHGNLRPSNILLNDRGDIFLADLATRSSQAHVGRLHTLSLDSHGYLPPEIATNLGDASYSPVADTYAMGMILYRAIMTPPGTSHATRNLQVDLPALGLDKATLLNLKDRVQEHLREQDSNARFHSRVAERAAAVLNRAISLETSPSPPFRFNRMEDFIPRIDEVGSLVRPGIQSVGKVLLDRPPAIDTFETGEPVLFSVAVAASAGVEDHEEISCGIALFDEESGERLRTAECSYSADRHPSGRFRFAFVLPDLAPGRYRTKVAFAIRDSGHPPVTNETDFSVRAAPGYVPEQREPGPQALPFQRAADVPVDLEDLLPSEAVESPPVDADADTMPDADLPTPKPLAPGAAGRGPASLAEPVFSPASLAMPAQEAPPAEVTTPVYGEETETEEAPDSPDPLAGQSWTELPLPGPLGDAPAPRPEFEDENDDIQLSKLEQWVELMKDDPYVAFMGAGILLVVLLIVALFVLHG